MTDPSQAMGGVVVFAIAYDRGPIGPSLISLLPGGKVGERRILGYSPAIAVTPTGLFTAALDDRSPSSAPNGGTVRLLPFVGPAADWTVPAVAPPTRVDGPTAHSTGAWVGAGWYQSSVLAPQGFYTESLEQFSLSGAHLASVPIQPCGVAGLHRLSGDRLLVVCSGSGSGSVISDGHIQAVVPLAVAAWESVGAGAGDQLWLTGSDGTVVLQDLNGKELQRIHLAGRQAGKAALGTNGNLVAVPTATSDEFVANIFSKVSVYDSTGRTVADIRLPSPGISLTMAGDTIFVGSQDDCVRSFTATGKPLDSWCDVVRPVQFLAAPSTP